MGHGTSAIEGPGENQSPGPAPPPTPVPARVGPALLGLARHPPLHCVFHYEAQTVSGQLALPLVYEKPDPAAVGTRLMDLELWLRGAFAIPPAATVFAVVPAEELYSPPFPLVMLNTVALALYRRATHAANSSNNDLGVKDADSLRLGDDLDEPPARQPVLHLALVVRSMRLLRQPIPRVDDGPESPFLAIPAATLAQREPSIARDYARRRFVDNLMRYGFARVEVTPEQAAVPSAAFARVREWLAAQLALPKDQRWRERVDETTEDLTSRVSKGRFVGFNADRNREYLQLRRPIAASGTVWPPAYFANDPGASAFASEMLALLELLDGIARDCMRAVCAQLNLDPAWVFGELLDDPTAPPASPDAIISVDPSYRYGASVLRVYNYRNKGATASDVHPEDASCAVHADLGLVTVSPVATVPGLQMWNLDRMSWTDVEVDAGPLHFSVFAGETLGFLTNGVITGPLHRVPLMCGPSEDDRRMSMPYFLRVRPDKCLNPRAEPPAARITCRDFMEDIISRKRPWRREDPTNAPQDY